MKTTKKDEFIQSCKEEMRELTLKKKLIIHYLRERTPKPREGVRPTAQEAKVIRRLLNAAPNLTPKGYLSMLEIQGVKTAGKEKELTDKFITSRSFWRAMRSPRIGCVVAFNDSETGLNVGWSLCRVKSEGRPLDSFNRWIGIHEAIKCAVPTDRHIESTTTILADLIHQTERLLYTHNEVRKSSPGATPPETPIPHTLLPHVKNMVLRATKIYAPKEEISGLS